jgi:hypothetical protein
MQNTHDIDKVGLSVVMFSYACTKTDVTHLTGETVQMSCTWWFNPGHEVFLYQGTHATMVVMPLSALVAKQRTVAMGLCVCVCVCE